ncbi:hypothetical protein WG909_05690 [Peptostreptococcaceae bacterium AGR-M142]
MISNIGSSINNFKGIKKTEIGKEIKKAEHSIKENDTNEDNIYVKIAKKYDVTNLTHDEFVSMCKELWDAKEIDLAQYALMAIDTSKIKVDGEYIKFQKNSLNYTFNEAFDGKKHNWIEHFELRHQLSLKFGVKISYKNDIKHINLMKKIKAYQ